MRTFRFISNYVGVRTKLRSINVSYVIVGMSREGFDLVNRSNRVMIFHRSISPLCAPWAYGQFASYDHNYLID